MFLLFPYINNKYLRVKYVLISIENKMFNISQLFLSFSGAIADQLNQARKEEEEYENGSETDDEESGGTTSPRVLNIASIALKWVEQLPHVSGVIVGSRLGEREHVDDNVEIFTFELSKKQLDDIQCVLTKGRRVHLGGCGDEYRTAPYLTSTGDLSHHLTSGEEQQQYKVVARKHRSNMWEVRKSF